MAPESLKTLRPLDFAWGRIPSFRRGIRQAQGFYPERSRRIKKGILITFEGPEGCGKSTHAKLLYDYLKARHAPVRTREPGGTKFGEKIRSVLLHSKGMDISVLAELFLFEACRAQLVKEVIVPALADKRIVICDRFSDATTAYQGYGGGIPLKQIEQLNEMATRRLNPDLTILLDVDVVTGLRRARAKGADRMEKKEVSYHKRLRAGYLKLSRENPDRIKIIEVEKDIAKTQKLVRREVMSVIQRYIRAR
ncbi:MAG: dTMP kinase [Candidatus Omnitrophota bacterium]|nr:dTMP kinase [Candidatus Omnitrophota bacterium]